MVAFGDLVAGEFLVINSPPTVGYIGYDKWHENAHDAHGR